MKLLIAGTSLPHFPSVLINKFSSTCCSRYFISRIPLPLHRKHIWRKPIYSSISASSISDFGGWDGLESPEGQSASGQFKQFRDFFISIGIDDGKHALVFLTGFASALAIARVRLSSVAVIVASVLVFLIGFLAGIAREGGVVGNRIASYLEKHSGHGEVTADKLRSLMGILGELDVKISELKVGVEATVNSSSLGVGEISRHREIVESLRLWVMSAKGVLETLSGADSRMSDSDGRPFILSSAKNSVREQLGEVVLEKNSNQKLVKKQELSGVGLDTFQLLVSRLLHEISVVSKPQKGKDSIKQESKEKLDSPLENNQVPVKERNGNGNVFANSVTKDKPSALSDCKLEDVKTHSLELEALDERALNSSCQGEMIRPNKNVGTLSTSKSEHSRKLDFDEPGHKGKRSKAWHKEVNGKFPETSSNDPITHDNTAAMLDLQQVDYSRNQISNDDFLSPEDVSGTADIDLKFNNKHLNFQEQSLRNQGEIQTPHAEVYGPDVNGVFEDDKLSVENETSSRGRKEELGGTMKFDDRASLNNHRYVREIKQDEAPSSPSEISGDTFNRRLEEANGLLLKARECLTAEVDVEMAEFLLCNSASILSKAVQMKPRNLQAVGQLGNVFLLHGELKFKKSRELRDLLSGNDDPYFSKGSRARYDRLKYEELGKNKITSILVDVCEECEGLLIDAGSKYRVALSIDGDDVRALYNWGLALSYRAQLIADVGPKAALDADKVYLAAIDKFDAMLSKSNAYASDALFRWGVVLQLRSQLRPGRSKEKLKLLHQAKRLLEDALHMDSDNPQVREALSSCVSDMDF